MINNVQYYLRQEEIFVENEAYGESVDIKVIVPSDRVEKVMDDLTQKTNGQIRITKGDEGYYPL
jgi:putative IMPACT (imprinted ancient) family translation regulator